MNLKRLTNLSIASSLFFETIYSKYPSFPNYHQLSLTNDSLLFIRSEHKGLGLGKMQANKQVSLEKRPMSG